MTIDTNEDETTMKFLIWYRVVVIHNVFTPTHDYGSNDHVTLRVEEGPALTNSVRQSKLEWQLRGIY